MRVVQNNQMAIGEVDVSQIKFDPKSRDDIPKILRGLQQLHMDTSLRSAIFALLESQIAPKVNKRNGRPSMTLWNILVCGVIRQLRQGGIHRGGIRLQKSFPNQV